MVPLFTDLAAVSEYDKANNAGDEATKDELDKSGRLQWLTADDELSDKGRHHLLVLEDDFKSSHGGRLVRVRVLNPRHPSDSYKSIKGWMFAGTLQSHVSNEDDSASTRMSSSPPAPITTKHGAPSPFTMPHLFLNAPAPTRAHGFGMTQDASNRPNPMAIQNEASLRSEPELKAEHALTSEEAADLQAAAQRKKEIEDYVHGIKVLRLQMVKDADGREERAALMRFPGRPGAYLLKAGSNFDNGKVIRVSFDGAIIEVGGETFLIPAPPDSQ